MVFSKKIHDIITGQKQRVVITMHKRPDGDALGSTLALGRILQHYGHHVKIISPTVYPTFLSWLPDIDKVIVAERTSRKKLENIIHQSNIIFCLDFSEYHRLGIIADYVRTSQATKIVIDHHPCLAPPISTSEWTLCLPSIPATTIVLYHLLEEIGLTSAIDVNTATTLYVGIVSDTGFFCHTNVNPDVHIIAAKLLEKGIDFTYIHYQLLSNIPLNRLQFTAHAIQNRLVVIAKHHLAYFAIPRTDIADFKLKAGDTGSLIAHALNIKDIYIAGKLTEQKDAIHISLRSFGDIRINKLAEEYFDGGGHMNAAGGISSLSLAETSKKLEQAVKRLVCTTPYAN